MGRHKTEDHPPPCLKWWCGSLTTQCSSGCSAPSAKNPKGNHRRDCPCNRKTLSDSASSSVQLDACDSAAGPGTETGALKRARGGDDAASPDGSAWHSDAESSCSALNREERWCSGNIWPSTSSSSHAAPVTDIICSKSERLLRRPKSYEW